MSPPFDKYDLRSLIFVVAIIWVASVLLAQQFCWHLECEAKGKAKKEKAPKQEAEGTARNLKQGSDAIAIAYNQQIPKRRGFVWFCVCFLSIFSKCTKNISLQRGPRTVRIHGIPEVEKSKQQDRPRGGKWSRPTNRAEAPNQCGM